MAMPPRYLINTDGTSLESDLPQIAVDLSAMSNGERFTYRNENARSIASHEADRILIVAGPGTGKSKLFRDRVKHWLDLHPNESIYVSSFVRKLVNDLRAEISSDCDISESDQARIDVTTLHGLARSLVEGSGGTASHPLSRHIRMVATPRWLDMVWADVMQFHVGLPDPPYSRRVHERQFHSEEYDDTMEWDGLRTTYFDLRTFFNAMGFADMVVLAREAVDENPELIEHLLWIIDEFQDFNAAEDHLIRAVSSNALGVLMAGDDDQAIYQDLKSSKPEIICSYYEGQGYANAMLPFCSRCDYFICLGAAEFIAKQRSSKSIDKVYLPLKVDDSLAKIRMVATFAPGAAVEYIERFLRDHAADLTAHEERMRSGTETDPFLLILTPDKNVKFYRGKGDANKRLLRLVENWSVVDTGHSEGYRKVATYYSAAKYPSDNFAVRQVMDYEGVPTETAHIYIAKAMATGSLLADVLDPPEIDSLQRAADIAAIIDSAEMEGVAKAAAITKIITIASQELLAAELEQSPIGTGGDSPSDEEGDEAIETAGAVAAVELMTMFQSKGLSAQHVMIIGCDDANLSYTTPLTFFVALTRARRSLHLMTSMKAGGAKSVHSYQRDIPESCCEFGTYKVKTHTFELLNGMSGFAQQLDSWGSLSSKYPSNVAGKRAASHRGGSR